MFLLCLHIMLEKHEKTGMTIMLSAKQPYLRAIFYALGGFVFWVIGDTFIKLASMTGAPRSAIMAIGSLSGMISIGSLLIIRGELPRLKPSRLGPLLLLTFLFLINYGSFIVGLRYMPIADFYAIVFVAPILISVLASIYMREHMSLRQWIALLIGFIGVIIAINPSDLLYGTTHQWEGYIAAIVAMLCLTMQMLILRLVGESENKECLAFYPRLGPLMGGVLMLSLTPHTEPMSIEACLYSLAIGGIGGFGWVLIAQAYKMAPAGIIAPFQYFEIVVGATVGYLIWGDIPSTHLILGVAIIVSVGIYMVRHTPRHDSSEPNLPLTFSFSSYRQWPPHLRGICFSLAAFTMWVVADTFMKLAGESSLPSYEIVFFLGFFSSLFMLLKATHQKKLAALWPKQPSRQITQALLALGCNLANVVALNHLPLTLFYIAVFTAPLMVAPMAAYFLHEKLGWQKITAILSGFVGVLIAVNPFDVGHNGGDWIGYAAATISTACFSISIVWLRNITRSESVDSLAFFSALIQAGVGLFFMMMHMESVDLWTLLILLMMSLFCVTGNVFHYTALSLTTAANVAQFHYTQIIAGAILGYLIWHDVPAWNTYLGALIIIIAGLYIAARARHQSTEAGSPS